MAATTVSPATRPLRRSGLPGVTLPGGGRTSARRQAYRSLRGLVGHRVPLVLILALGLAIVVTGGIPATGWAQPATPAPANPCLQPGPRPAECVPDPNGRIPAGLPAVTPVPSPTPTTASPITTPVSPVPAPASCAPSQPGQPAAPECIPQPTTPAAPTPAAPAAQPSQGPSSCGFVGWMSDFGGCLNTAITGFFRGVVTQALNPMLALLSTTLLATPTLDQLPRIGELWTNSWQIMLACYAMLIMIGGVVVMAYASVQSRHSIKEILPRAVIGFLAGALSLFLAGKAIEIANALSQAVMAGGVDPASAATTLTTIIRNQTDPTTSGIFIVILGLVMAVVLVALLLVYIIRVALTVILVAGAPLALMCHALPATEGIARWWWRIFGGCLAVQIAQSLTLIVALRVLLAPGGFSLFGPTRDGLVNILVSLAVLYILFKIPFWVLSSVKGGGHRGSLLGGLARAYIAGKTLGLVGGRGGRAGAATAARTTAASRDPGAPSDPPWPEPPKVYWGTPQGNARLQRARGEILAHRLHQQPRQPTTGTPRSAAAFPRFVQPTPQVPTHELATGTATERPAMPAFRTTHPTHPPAESPTPATPRRASAPPLFRAPGTATAHRGTPTVPPAVRTASVPEQLRFRPPTPPSPATTSPVPASAAPVAPVFHPSQPQAGGSGRRARTATPAPVRFQAPPPPAPAPPASTPDASTRSEPPTPAPAPRARRARRARVPRSGGDTR